MKLLKQIVLYISDNKFMHIILKDTLKAHKIEVIDVYSGLEALQTLSELTPDLILSDIDMPGMTGFELCRTLNESPKYSNIPFVIYSSSESEGDIEKAYALGAKGYIIKKYHKEALARKIIHFLK